MFYAQGVKANVLFFDRKPASETPWTQDLWIYDLRTNRHFTLKTSPLTRADLDDFVACYNAESRREREETERFHRFSYDDLLKRDKANLDIFCSATKAWKTPQPSHPQTRLPWRLWKTSVLPRAVGRLSLPTSPQALLSRADRAWMSGEQPPQI